MFEGIYADKVLMFPETRPCPIEPQETSGVPIGSQPIYRYSLKDSDYPTLIIIDEIKDENGVQISSGYYELGLSDEKDFFILMQTKQPIAIIPTFKIEEDKSLIYPDEKTKKIKKKQEEERQKTNKKRAKIGISPDTEKIYMDAKIEYIKEGNYYLIKYERGHIRAWGAIKAVN